MDRRFPTMERRLGARERRRRATKGAEWVEKCVQTTRRKKNGGGDEDGGKG